MKIGMDWRRLADRGRQMLKRLPKAAMAAAAVSAVAVSVPAVAVAQSQGAAQDRTNCSNFAINVGGTRSLTVASGGGGTVTWFSGSATGGTNGGTSHTICGWTTTVVSQGAKGTGSGSASSSGGSLSYSANAGASGTDTFVIRLTSSYSGGSGQVTVNVTITAPPAPTVANISATTPYRTLVTMPASISGNATGVEVVSGPSMGTATVSGLSFRYEPYIGRTGTDTFTYRATSAGGNSNTATATVTIQAPAAPTVSNISTSTGHNTAVNVTGNVSGEWSRLDVGVPQNGGTASVSGGTMRYTPPTGFYGTDRFAYSATGPGGRSADATVTVTVAPPPAPSAGNLTVDFAYETGKQFAVPVSGEASSISVTSLPSNGSADWFLPTITYTPAAGFYGNDSLRYRVNGPGGSSPEYTVTLRVAAPAAPGAGNVSASTAYETAVNIGLTPSGVYSSVSKVADPTNGSVTITGTTARYTPAAGFYGTDTFTYRASGPGGNSPTRTVTVTVSPPPAPTVSNATMSVGYETNGTITLPVSGVYTSVVAVTAPSRGAYQLNGRTFSYTPNNGVYGTDTFVFRATGPGGNSANGTVTITIAAPAAPGAGNVSASTAYETAVNIALTPTGEYTSVALGSAPANGTASLTGTTVRYTPAAGFYGTDSFVYRAIGPGGNSPTRTVTVTVAVPPAPTADNQTQPVNYESAASFNLSVGGVYTGATIIAQPSKGTVSLSGTRATYTAGAGQLGSDTFTWRASGPGGNSPTRTVTMTINTPAAPTLSNQTASTAYNTARAIPITIGGVWTDFGAGENGRTEQGGTVTVSGSTVTYQPPAGFIGQDTFGILAGGPGGYSNHATVTVTVAAPAAPTVTDKSVTTAYQTAITTTLPVTGIHDGWIVNQGENGATAVVGDSVTYTPAAGFVGTDEFRFRATGPGGQSNAGTITVTVSPPPAPGAGNVSATTAYQTAADIALTPTGVYSTVEKVGDPAHGTVTITGTTARYTPASGYYGTDAFTYRAVGLGGASPARTVTITVGNPPAPTATGQDVDVVFGQAKTFPLIANGVYLTLETVDLPRQGTVTINGDDATYTPGAGYFGADSFTFRAVGPGGASAKATVDLVVGLPPAPTVEDTTLVTGYETPGSVQLPVDGVTQRVFITQGQHGTVTISGTTATYAPRLGFYGSDTFTYRASGPGGDSTWATVTVTVGLPPAPTVTDTTLTTAFQTARAVVLPAQGVLTTVNVVKAPEHGSASITGTTLTYTPAAGYYGADELTFTATGPGGTSSIATLSITVGLPATPVIGNLTLTTRYEEAVTGSFAVTGYSPVLALASDPANGAAIVAGRNVTYTPAAGFYGQDTFTVTAENAGGVSAPATVTVNVGVPAAPTLPAASLTTPYEQVGTVELAPSGVYSGIEIVSQPAHGDAAISGRTLTFTPDALFYGADTMRVRAVGPGGASSAVTVTINVGLPGAPSIQAATLTTAYESAGSVALVVTGVHDRVEIVATPDHGAASLDGETVRYTPAAGYYGADSLTVRAVGPGGSSAPATVTVAVGLPPAPAALPIELRTAYETEGTAQLRASGVTSSFGLVTPPSHGVVSLDGDRVTYTPAAAYYGADVFSYRATGPGGASAPALVSVEVGLPGAPVARAGELETPFETIGTVVLAASGVHDAFAIASDPAHGTVALAGDEVRYTPATGYYGDDAFTFTVSGPGGVSAPATIRVKVGLPGKPVASPGSIQVAYQTSGVATLRATGIFDRFTITTEPQHGRVVIDGDEATYTPDALFFGADAFAYTATGPGGQSNPAVIAVTVGLPGAPVVADADLTTAYETAGEVRLAVSGRFDRIELAGDAANGTAALTGEVLRYTPSAGFYGVDAVKVRAVGPGGISELATVAITVVRPDAPTVADVELATAYETPGEVSLTVTGLITKLELIGDPSNGVASLAGETVRYVPNDDYFGDDAVRVRATGPGGVSGVATVTIKVGRPAAPIVADAALSTPYETAGEVALDVSGVFSTVEIVGSPANGKATLDGETLAYTPMAGFFGADAVKVRATGPGGPSAVATVSVNVGLPDAPTLTAEDLALSTPFETPVSADLTASGVWDHFVVVDVPSNGGGVIDGETLTYTPAAGFFGQDVLTYAVVGPGGQSAARKVVITVGVPAPAAQDVAIATDMDVAVTADLAKDIAHAETAEVIKAPTSGKVTITGTEATYTPDPAFFGTDSFTFTLEGLGGVSEVATATVTVEGGPPPKADELEKTGLSGEPIVFDVTAGLEGGPFSAVRLEPGSGQATPESHHGGTVRVDGLRIVFTPAADWTGKTSFAFAVENRFGWSEPALATAIVNPRPETGAVIEAETWAGRAVDVALTENARGGPFLSADIVSATPADALDLAINQVGDGYVLTATPRGQFFGLVEIRYTLRNAYSVSEPGLVRLTVKERPDPSRDPEVTGLVNAQTQAAYRFSSAQMTNVLRRLEQLHGAGPRRNHVGLSLVPMDDLDAIPGDNEAMRAMRDYMEQAGMIEHGPAGAAPASDAPRAAAGGSEDGRVAWWMEGAIDLGFKRRDSVREGFQFTTDGLTVGADARVSDSLTVGIGAGYGRDQSDVGAKGTTTSADAYSGFAYASWQPREKLFVDGVLGYTSMTYDATRYVTETGGLLDSQRSGRQVFGALSAGYEHRGRRLHWSPYGRLEFADVTLGGFREYGDDLWALEFAEQNSSQVRAALGVHGDYLFRYRTGDLKPTFRVEYLHDLKNGGEAGVRYADWLASPDYQIELSPYDDRNLRLGLGLTWQALNGTAFGLEYESTVVNSAGQEGRVRLDFSTTF